jgi:hypothetical protein
LPAQTLFIARLEIQMEPGVVTASRKV